MLPAGEHGSLAGLLLTSLNSFVQDYASRQKLGGTLARGCKTATPRQGNTLVEVNVSGKMDGREFTF